MSKQPDFILIVTGGRDWTDQGFVFDALDEMHAHRTITCVVEGGCPTGVDLFARRWARSRRVMRRTFAADWTKWGNRAGPIRNREMFEATRHAPARACAVFPGNRGTADCRKAAREAGCDVWDVAPPADAFSSLFPTPPVARG